VAATADPADAVVDREPVGVDSTDAEVSFLIPPLLPLWRVVFVFDSCSVDPRRLVFFPPLLRPPIVGGATREARSSHSFRREEAAPAPAPRGPQRRCCRCCWRRSADAAAGALAIILLPVAVAAVATTAVDAAVALLSQFVSLPAGTVALPRRQQEMGDQLDCQAKGNRNGNKQASMRAAPGRPPWWWLAGWWLAH